MESLGDTQSIELGIRGVQRRIRGAKIQTTITNVIGRLFAIGAVVWVALQFADLIDFTNAEKFPDGHLLDSLTLIFIFFENIALVLFSLPLMIFLLISGEDANAILLGARAFITVDLFNNVSPPGEMTTSGLYGVGDSAVNALFSPFAYYFANLGTLKVANRASILILFVILFSVAVAAFLLRADMRSATAAFVCIQLVVYYGSVKLLFKPGFSFSPTRNFGELITNKVVLIALASYLFLEIALQISYMTKILNPAQSRQERVLRALDRLKEFRLGITSSQAMPVVGEAEEGAETDDSGDKKSGSSITGASSSIRRKFGLAGLTYFMEKASDSLFARPGGQRDKLTARLQRYHDGLIHSDPKVDDKLVGASIAITPFKTLMYVGISVIFRVGIMLGGLYAILNPDILLFFLRYPPSIYNSLEMLEPEGVVLLLIPLVIFILLFTSLLGFIQEKFSARVEEELEPILEDMEYMEDDRSRIITEEDVAPVSEEDLFYEQLSAEFDEDSGD
ncbi:MAG: hypothetical protein H7647_08740 [Candidatus Heimdallarchaeota archaeon]|nr:hypothetical protein [Candidatus Heimdallarchaeota archaeon]MCK4254513.1 hypothetical protein [Candidatus Heimdallarchaeota archaeon]